MEFYVGLHQPSDAYHFERCMVSVNRLRRYRRPEKIRFNKWLMDSGAFTEISQYGEYRSAAADYAREVERWASVGELLACVSQDYMCEPFILRKTGKTVREHQILTIERYDAIRKNLSPLIYLMPVLQGFAPSEYVDCAKLYDDRIVDGAWVGVGSVCKRNADPDAIYAVLETIKTCRPGLLLHGFGLKRTALEHSDVRRLLWSADSMAWSFAARYEGRNANDWREAKAYERRILSA